MYGIFSNVVYILCLLKVRGISGNVKGRNKTDVDVQSNLCREYIICFRYVQVCYRPVNFFWFWKRKNISLLGILCPVLVIHNSQQAAFSTSCFLNKLLSQQAAFSTSCFLNKLLSQQAAFSTSCFLNKLLSQQAAVSTSCFLNKLLSQQAIANPS